MAATDYIWGSGTPLLDMACKNTDGTNDLVAGDTVTIDSTNVLSTTQGEVAVLRSTTDDSALGVCVENIPKGSIGRVRVYGVAMARASGVITAGGDVQCDTTGRVKALAGGKPSHGKALATTASDGDPIPVLLFHAKNA